MHRGSSFAGRLTKALTGQAVMASGGYGSSAIFAPASQEPNAVGARITGIRWWIGAAISLVAAVRIANGSRSSMPINQGRFAPPSRLHSWNPSVGIRQRREANKTRNEGLARRLRTRVDGLVADPGIPGPIGDRTPARHRKPTAAVPTRADDCHFLVRRDVIAGPEVQRRSGEVEEQIGPVPGEGLHEAAAHAKEGGQPPRPRATLVLPSCCPHSR